MLKYYNAEVTFAEFPDEIALCVNISHCPCHCDGCSEPWLKDDVGKELTQAEIDRLIAMHPDITLLGLMGGDFDHDYCAEIATYIHQVYPNIKVGMYSGLDSIDLNLARVLDCYKIGRFIMPKGDPKTWPTQVCGPIQFPFSNQKYYELHNGMLVDCTYKFRNKPLNDYTKYIIITS